MAAIARQMGRAPGFSPPVGRTGGCAFTLDVQWILDVVDRVKQVVERIGRTVQQVVRIAQKILGALGGIADLFCWMPGIGKVLKSAVEHACKIIDRTVGFITKGINTSLEVFKHVLAPWEVRSAGKSIADELAPKCQTFALQYQRGHFKSAETWTGDASDAFFASIKVQEEAADSTAKGAKAFGDAVHEMGAKGVDVTVTFVTQYITTAIGVIVAALEMAAVPVGTAIGAAQVIGLITKIIAYVMTWINAMIGLITSMVTMENAAHQAVPGGTWPPAVVG